MVFLVKSESQTTFGLKVKLLYNSDVTEYFVSRNFKEHLVKNIINIVKCYVTIVI